MRQNIGVQMYTLRHIINQDIDAYFNIIKKIGYSHIELAGFYDLKPETLKNKVEQASLQVSSCHIGLSDLETRYQTMKDYLDQLDVQHVVIPYADIKDSLSYHKLLPHIKAITEQLNADGFTVHYHHHAHEFQTIDGLTVLEHLLRDVPTLYLELDVYWAKVAGIDLHHWIEAYSNRIILLHAKDYQLDQQGHPYFESVGKGMIDFKKIISQLGNLQCIIVENDQPKNDPIINIKDSIRYLKKEII